MSMKDLFIDLNIHNAKSSYHGHGSIFEHSDKYKFIVFIDSTLCASCLVDQFSKYHEISNYASENGCELIMILNPKKSKLHEL